MKKLMALIICAVMCFGVFAACGGKTEAASLQSVYASLEQVSEMPEMAVMPDSLIETLFGFDLTQFEEYVFAEADAPDVNADTVILIKLNDTADSESVVSSLEVYLESVKENTQSYSPENYAKTADSAVALAGNYIYLIITKNYHEAVDVINQAGIK